MHHKYTFNPSTRYITKGISETIPVEIQLFMWHEVDKVVQKEKVDYLQVFEIRVKEDLIEIEHRQEEPPYKEVYRLKKLDVFKELKNITIFVIDDIDHSTMLLASEY